MELAGQSAAGNSGGVEVATCDYHTAGEPFRIVVDGVPDIPGGSVLERRDTARSSEEIDFIRRLLCHEPRGHADMYGGFVVPADDKGADFGVLFWHKDGYSTACGHGTIALGAWAVESGLVAEDPSGETLVTIDVPSGRVCAVVCSRDRVVESVLFNNVPSYVVERGIQAGSVTVDVAYGGALYAMVSAEALGLSVSPGNVSELIAAGRAVKAALSDHPVAKHPTDDRLSGIYGTIIFEAIAPGHQRNVTIFADGEVDRSPCGSGTSARCVSLHADGQLSVGQDLRHESIVGTEFRGRVLGESSDGVMTQVEGMAYKSGEHKFVLDPRDPVGTGFVLR